MLAIVLQLVCPACASELNLTNQVERDSYVIYSMLLKLDEWRVYSPILGIRQETEIYRPATGVDEPPCVWPEPSSKQQDRYRSLIEDFKRRNARPFSLQEKFDLPSYRLLGVHQVEEVAKKFPFVPPPPGTREPLEDPKLKEINAVFFLSAVGFSAEHKRALVYVATWTGGRYYFLVRKGGKWILDKNYRGSIYNWVQ